MNKKLTVTKLRALKRKKDETFARFKALDNKLDDVCHCPRQFMVTIGTYQTDTLGTNGYTTYYDRCKVCGKHHGGSYSGTEPHFQMSEEL